MKIELDLNTLFTSEEMSLEDAIRQEVVDTITRTIEAGISRRLDDEIARILNTELASAVKDKMPAIIADVLNTEYVSVDRYGSRGKPTTFRTELIREIHEQMQYKPQQYESGENIFTKAVKAVVSTEVAGFKAAFTKQVDALFVAETMKFAVETLQKKLGLTK